MRFNCQSCGAKYQIADEKVAGKTVRMKCRKCETLIQVRAKHLDDGTVEAEHVTGPPSVRPGAMPARASRPPGPPPPSSRSGAGRPSSPGGLPRPNRISSPGGLPPARASRPAGPPRPGSPPRPSAPKPSAPKPSAPKPSALKPPAPKPAPSEPQVGEGTVVMRDPRLAASETAPKPDDDAVWYVGIDGEPVGPVGKAYLQDQVDADKVKPGSLVWREGLTDWKPLNSFAELRPLLTSRKPVAAPVSNVSAPVALTRKVDEPEAGTERMVAKPDAADAEDEGESKAAPVAAPAPDPDSEPKAVPVVATEAKPASPPAPDEPPSAVATSKPDGAAAAVAAAAPKPVVATSVPSELEPAGVPAPRKGVHPMAWAFVAMAAAFGAVSAWFLFGQDKPEPGRTAMNASSAEAPEGTPTERPPDGGEATSAENGDDGADEGETSDRPEGATPARVVPGQNGQAAGGPSSDGGVAPDDDGGDAKKAPKPCNPDDPFCSPGNVDGPSAGPASGKGSESGQGLSQSEAASTVSRYRGSLMRRCRSMVTGGSAKVAATITVAPSGAVQSAAVSGGKDYPGLASCVQSRIMSWRFPSSGGTSTISVSFNFL